MLILYQAVLRFRTYSLQQRLQSQQIRAIRRSCLRQSETAAEGGPIPKSGDGVGGDRYREPR